jgi:hypothetical protein
MSAPSANTRQFGWTSSPQSNSPPPQDQQRRTYVKHWPNIYFVFANLSWAEQDGEVSYRSTSLSQDVPSNLSQYIPEGKDNTRGHSFVLGHKELEPLPLDKVMPLMMMMASPLHQGLGVANYVIFLTTFYDIIFWWWSDTCNSNQNLYGTRIFL